MKALIFDVDGTLAETEGLHLDAFNATFAAVGLPWAWSEADYLRLLTTTGGKERIARHVRETGGDPDGPGAASDPLARSGSDGPLLSLALLPVALVAAGMALLFAARRRSRTQQPADQLEGEE